MTIKPENLDTIQKRLNGDALNLCSRQGRPHGGWEMIVEVKGIPAIIRDDNCKSLYHRYLNLVTINEEGQDPDSKVIYAEYGLNVLMQCPPKYRNIKLEDFLSLLTWKEDSDCKLWLKVAEVTIERMFKTQEFHKHVIARMWESLVTDCLGFFSPPKGPPSNVGPYLEQQSLDMRYKKTKREAQSWLEAAKTFAIRNWLP